MADNEQNLSDISRRIQSRRRKFTQINLVVLLLFLGIMGLSLLYGFQKYSQLQQLDEDLASTSNQVDNLAQSQTTPINVDSLRLDISESLARDVVPEAVRQSLSENPPPPQMDSAMVNRMLAELSTGIIEDKVLSLMIVTQDSLITRGSQMQRRITDYEQELTRLRAQLQEQTATIRDLESRVSNQPDTQALPLSTTRIMSEKAGVAFTELDLVVTVGRFTPRAINDVDIYVLGTEELVFSDNVPLDTDVSFVLPGSEACTHVVRIRRITRIPLFKDQMQVVIRTNC